MRGQPPRPPGRRGGGALGDAGDRAQPGPGPVIPVRLVPLLASKHRKDPRPRRGVLGFGVLQPDQRLGLRRCREAACVTAREVAEPGAHHRQRLARTGRRGGLGGGAHGAGHLPAGAGTVRYSITSSIITRPSDSSGARTARAGKNERKSSPPTGPRFWGPGPASGRPESGAGVRVQGRVQGPGSRVQGRGGLWAARGASALVTGLRRAGVQRARPGAGRRQDHTRTGSPRGGPC